MLIALNFTPSRLICHATALHDLALAKLFGQLYGRNTITSQRKHFFLLGRMSDRSAAGAPSALVRLVCLMPPGCLLTKKGVDDSRLDLQNSAPGWFHLIFPETRDNASPQVCTRNLHKTNTSLQAGHISGRICTVHTIKSLHHPKKAYDRNSCLLSVQAWWPLARKGTNNQVTASMPIDIRQPGVSTKLTSRRLSE